ncbi:peptide deformylase [Puniceibacterium sediminis]|uniref:Peptide deformylase n=1 Tax=Puniceibacterium sediminis TaxID=1608407 RepID=A0A238Z7K4_9RHOB|nr:peptide deformylase [Puniceibacterium sediminis]SNR78921.1 peptide deformylase [Puniceibacterium sediminis]
MSVLPILRWPDPHLSQVCAPVTDVAAVRGLVTDMFETMYDAPGRGLAAPQIGVLLRVFVMDVGWKTGERTPVVCINPRIVAASDEVSTREEGCLSIPGVLAEISRPEAVTLEYLDLDGVTHSDALEGPAAMCAQHELDHLDGLVTFDRLDPAARAALIAEYEAV